MKSLLTKLLLGHIGRELRKVAEGGYGVGPQRIYLALQGQKRRLGLLLACLAAALYAAGTATGEPGLITAAAMVGTLAGVLVSAGLVDASWRADRPQDERLDRIKALIGPDLALVFAAGAAALQVCDPSTAAWTARLHLTCGQAQGALAALAAVLGLFGVMSEARLADPPKTEGGK